MEHAALEWLAGLGHTALHGPGIGPVGPAPVRGSYGEVLLIGRPHKARARLNPNLPFETTPEEALRKVQQAETPSLNEESRRLHR